MAVAAEDIAAGVDRGCDLLVEHQDASPAFYSPRPCDVSSSNEKLLSAVAKLSFMLDYFSKSQKAMNEDLFRELRSLSNEQIFSTNKQLVSSHDELMKRLSDLGDKYNTLSKDNAKLSDRCDGLLSDNERLSSLLTCALERIEYLERSSCDDEVIVTGLPEEPNEDLGSTMRSIGDASGVGFMRTDVVSARRLGSDAGEPGRPRSVLVRLSSHILRRELLQRKRLKGTLLAGDVPGLGASPDGSGRLYINESLPPATRRLRILARDFVAAEGWRRTWVRDGAVYIVKDVNSPDSRSGCGIYSI